MSYNTSKQLTSILETGAYIVSHPISLIMIIIGIVISYLIFTSDMLSGWVKFLLFISIIIVGCYIYFNKLKEYDNNISNCMEATLIKSA